MPFWLFSVFCIVAGFISGRVMDEEVDTFTKQLNSEVVKFPVLVTRVNSKIMDIMEGKKARGDKVTSPMFAAVRKLLEFMSQKSVGIFEENVKLTTQLEEQDKYSVAMQEIADRISRNSASAQADGVIDVQKHISQKREEFSVVVAMNAKSDDPVEMKTRIKNICKANPEAPVPKDVVVTKTNKVILRMSRQEDTEKMREVIMKDTEIKNKIKVNIPRKRRERLLILSVDPEVEQSQIEETIRKILQESTITDEVTKDLSKRIHDPTLDEGTRKTLRDLVYNAVPEFSIVRSSRTRQEKNNWLLDVDGKGKEVLLGIKRICIEFERYKIVEHIAITRCFKCQTYGHYSSQCTGEVHCTKCAEGHDVKDCKSGVTLCSNCYFENKEGECAHRADSPDCPVYQKYRLAKLANRS